MDTPDIIRQIESDPGLRAQLRAVLLGDEVLQLPGVVAENSSGIRDLRDAVASLTEQVDQLTQRMDQLIEQMTRLTERMDQLIEQMTRLTERVDQLIEQMTRLTERVDQLIEQMTRLTERVDRLTDQVGDLRGRDLERHVRERPSRVLPEDLEGVEIYDEKGVAKLVDLLQRSLPLTPQERRRVVRTDVLGEARRGTKRVTVVAEVSATIHDDDVTRTAETARILSDRGLRTVAYAIGYEVGGGEVERLAADQGVELVTGL
jgi:chromosome segregation ATPase